MSAKSTFMNTPGYSGAIADAKERLAEEVAVYEGGGKHVKGRKKTHFFLMV